MKPKKPYYTAIHMSQCEGEMVVDKDTLKQMHKFYTEEARHQRQMMWLAARWFTLILGALIGGIGFKLFSDVLHGVTLLILSALGYFVGLICMVLMRSFYKTNLVYISMFAKVENELKFDHRTRREAFRSDPLITWQGYADGRSEKCSQEFVRKNLKYTRLHMYSIISLVFALFSVSFVILWFFILNYVELLNNTLIFVTAIVILLSLILLYFGIKKVS